MRLRTLNHVEASSDGTNDEVVNDENLNSSIVYRKFKGIIEKEKKQSMIIIESNHHNLLQYMFSKGFLYGQDTQFYFHRQHMTHHIHVEGDIGLSFQPPESEKVNGLHSSRRYHPCIQLALSWEPLDEIHFFSNSQ